MMTKVYAIIKDQRRLSSIDDESFMQEAASISYIWTLSGFEMAVNLQALDLNKMWIRFIEVPESTSQKCTVCGYVHSTVDSYREG